MLYCNCTWRPSALTTRPHGQVEYSIPYNVSITLVFSWPMSVPQNNNSNTGRKQYVTLSATPPGSIVLTTTPVLLPPMMPKPRPVPSLTRVITSTWVQSVFSWNYTSHHAVYSNKPTTNWLTSHSTYQRDNSTHTRTAFIFCGNQFQVAVLFSLNFFHSIIMWRTEQNLICFIFSRLIWPFSTTIFPLQTLQMSDIHQTAFKASSNIFRLNIWPSLSFRSFYWLLHFGSL